MIVLASASPRRKELLKQIVEDFIIDIPNVDENSILAPLDDLASEIALAKANEVAKRHKDDIIISCDTMVILGDTHLGKPKDKKEAKTMLKLLSNKTHKVISGFVILSNNEVIQGKDISYVTFNELSDELIDAYVATSSPLDKAGAYGIQDKAFPIVKNIEGSYYNVMGFPLEKIKDILNSRL